MKKLLFLLFAFALFGLTACGDDDDGSDPMPVEATSLEIQFQATYGDDPLVLFQAVEHPEGYALIFSEISFYLSDLALIREDGSELILKDIDRIRMTPDHLDAASAENGTPYLIEDVPSGNYQGIRFGIGVREDLNAMEPADFDIDHPLNQPGQYWTGWESYIFVRTEGKADTLDDGIFEYDLALHTGGDMTYRVKDLLRPISIASGEKTVFPITIDYRAMLVPENKAPYDLIKTPQIHSLVHVDAAIELADNFLEAIE
jgi:hypothetical protein